jgi:hypothetical protein
MLNTFNNLTHVDENFIYLDMGITSQIRTIPEPHEMGFTTELSGSVPW